MTPEAKARLVIDAKLVEAGWRVQDLLFVTDSVDELEVGCKPSPSTRC